jgi:CubicO group peptidase (beta-lactamase class C family)
VKAWVRRVNAAAVAAMMTILLVMTSSSGQAGDPPSTPDVGVAAVIARYRAEIPALMAHEHVPGLSLAVVDRDRVVWEEGFGSTDTDGGSPVTVDTLFGVESMSKVFTATAAMQTVQAGRLDLDAPITTYLPDFTVHSAFETHPERKITLRMLLSHTAGFTHEAPVGNNYEPDPGQFDAHVRSISRTWLRFPVGTGVAYSNLGIDLAGYLLERVWDQPFPAVMQRSLLGPVGMDRSTFDRARVDATVDRALGHIDAPVPPPIDIGMLAAGGLWASAADLARFLRFQLGNGTVQGHRLLDPALVKEMRTVPAPHAGAPAGFALGVERTRWRDGQNLDLFDHSGGGLGFRSTLWWLPQLQLGIAVLTNSNDQDLPERLAERVLHDLVTEPGSRYRDRMLRLPTQSALVDPGSSFALPADLPVRIAEIAVPPSGQQSRRWTTYVGLYRTGEPGAMDPSAPTSRFQVESGVPYFDAAEDGARVRRRLTEFRPGLFLSEGGETLDLRGPSLYWRGIDLNQVNGGPLLAQWGILVAVALVAASWLTGAAVAPVHRRRHVAGGSTPNVTTGRPSAHGHGWRVLTVAVAASGAVAALVVVSAIALVPGLVDVGFLGWMAWPVQLRLALHLPLAVAFLAAGLVTLLLLGAIRRWSTPRIRALDVGLAVALTILATQLALWHLLAWGF